MGAMQTNTATVRTPACGDSTPPPLPLRRGGIGTGDATQNPELQALDPLDFRKRLVYLVCLVNETNQMNKTD